MPTEAPFHLFISYRRADEKGQVLAHMIYQEWCYRFGDAKVFLDVDTRRPGLSFPQKVKEALDQSEAVLAIIGPDWMKILEERRNEPRDWVRYELTEALAREGLPVVPVTCVGVALPAPEQLPETMSELGWRDGMIIDAFENFTAHFDRLLLDLTATVQEIRKRKAPAVELPPARKIVVPASPPLPLVPRFGQTLTSSIGLELVGIEPGTFTMGSPENEEERWSNEQPHEVTLTRGYWIGKYEVTQGEWEAVMGSNPSEFKGARNPVEQVSWEEALEFCRKLTEKERGAGKLPEGWKYSLPTEAQWEYACRAGTTTAFHYGNSLDATMANFNGNYPYGRGRKGEYREKTVPVGSFQPNAWGLYDMHGNVWEWCLDWHRGYPESAVTDPTGPESGTFRVRRGGSWFLYARFGRSANGFWGTPDFRSSDLGFRAAVVPSS